MVGHYERASDDGTLTQVFEPPGKGEWRSLEDHFPRACTAEYQRLLATGMAAGEADHFAAYGMPIRTLRPAFVHGHVYVGAEPLVGRAGSSLPPAPILWLAARLHPAFRRRERAARQALADRIWLADATRWWQVDRERWRQRCAEVEAIDPAGLDDDGLAAHLLAVRALCDEGFREHFRLHGCDLLPTSLLIVWAGERGIAPADVLAHLAGSSPASRGHEAPPAWRLVTGYDLDSRAACELPALPPAPNRPAVEPPDDATLLARVAPAERDELARLLDDARATYGVRDDNGLLTAAWPVGLLRRAMLETGRRLTASRRMAEVAHGVEATVDELVALLRVDPAAPSGDELARRAAQRDADLALRPPPVLGPGIEVPARSLPVGMRRVARALLTFRDLGTSGAVTRPALEGDGIGSGRAVGRAVVADDPAVALGRVEPGDVLVARGTAPAWNAVLALVAAVVVEEGGPLGHAAIVARELGIPAVVGAVGAVDLIPDGATVEVDSGAGVVRVIT